MAVNFTSVKAYSISEKRDYGRFVYVPTYHQQLGKERTSLPDVAAFFRFPHRVQRCVSRELQKDEEFEAQYTIFYTFDRDAYRHKSTAISDKIHERWFGEILVFRHGQKGHGERNVVNLDPRRGDSERVLWDVVRRFIADYESS